MLLALMAKPALGASSTAEEVRTERQPAEMYEKHGMVRFKPSAGAETAAALPQAVGFDEGLRTLELSGAALRFTDLSHLQLSERTRLEIVRQTRGTNAVVIKQYHGEAYVINRGRLGIQIETPAAHGVPRGTEFLVSVAGDGGESRFTMFDGEVDLSDALGSPPVRVHSGEQGIAVRGQRIKVVPILQATNIIQWWIYYPGVLDPDELDLTPAARTNLAKSLVEYRAGNLVGALEEFPGYPNPPEPATDAERVYLAALFLAVGAVDRSEAQLSQLTSPSPTSAALRTVISAVTSTPTFEPPSSITHHALTAPRSDEGRSRITSPSTASELLARCYQDQDARNLKAALASARASVERSPNFGFGWARVAELEFSFGHTAAARAAIQQSLALAPRNANAHAVHGFVLAAQNSLDPAISEFDEALQLDSRLGNAWLGRGLCKRRQGWWAQSTINHQPSTRSLDWLADLQAAATAESHRALLRSYLGKGLTDAGDTRLAEKELNFARKLDPNDPTPWLYSALLKQENNRINEAIEDLEGSQERNDNRSLFRSRLLLDEDRAVRSANLASIYRDAGMTNVSVREAAYAVTYDYANDAAHLFLSDSYNELRDPTRFNLRYETVWFNELLLANLLAPVGAGRLSQHLSQQEYSSLFEADGLHLANSTMARTDKMLTQLASQFGTFGRVGYSLDLEYHNNGGIRPNNELDSIEWYTTIKAEVTPQDTALLLFKYQDYHSGDNFQYYNPSDPVNGLRRHFSFDEYQHPIAMAGWHHEWSPGMHTLLLGGRIENEQFISDRNARQLLLIENGSGEIDASDHAGLDVAYHNQLEVYTGELNQIFQWNRLTLLAGSRYQSGSIDAHATMDNPSRLVPFFTDPPGTSTNSASHTDFERITGYGYLTIEALERQLWLSGGVAYEDMTFPSNFRNPPLEDGEEHRSHWGPKAAAVWQPIPQVTLRGMYAKSLGGVSLDQSYRLEPTQLAGFPQTFRTLISESVVGSVAAPEYEAIGGALDLKFPSRTYAGVQVERLKSKVRRDIGEFTLINAVPPLSPETTPENLDYTENSCLVSLNQLLGDMFSIGASYKFTRAELHDVLPDVPVSALATADLTKRSDLHQAGAYILFNHPSGFFARAESQWYHQSNSGDPTVGPGDDFFQHNLYAGYRFARRRAEILLGLLNLADQDYHLNPLTVYSELPRERAFMVRFNFQF